MSNHERKQNLPAIIKTAEATFTEHAKPHNLTGFTFARESGFALQILKQNEFLGDVACGNQDSLKDALVNLADIGLTLNPAYQLAYLVPRKKRVCLDISYKGLVYLATTRGVILWAKAELVREKDKFEYLGPNEKPVHKIKDMFGDRGAILGGYCIAKMPTGDFLIDVMKIEDIYEIRDRSEAWKAFKSGNIKSTPWQSDEVEMIKKTLIRRGSKSWPQSLASQVLEKAVSVLDDTEGADLNNEPAAEPELPDPKREEDFKFIRECLEALDREEPAYIEHLNRACNRSIKSLEDLTNQEIQQQITFLEGLVEAQTKRLEKLKASKEKTA